MADHSIPRAWSEAAAAILSRLKSGVADAVEVLAATVETPFGFAPNSNTVDETGAAIKPSWTATVIKNGVKTALVGVNPTAANDPASVMVALIHGLILAVSPETVTKDDAGNVKRVTRYGEAFTKACAGILDSPRKPRKDGTPGKFQGSQAFIPSPELAQAIADALPALPPLPFYYVPDTVKRTTVTLRFLSKSGRKWSTNAKIFNKSDAKIAAECLSLLLDSKADGMTPDPENEVTMAWVAELEAYATELENAA